MTGHAGQLHGRVVAHEVQPGPRHALAQRAERLQQRGPVLVLPRLAHEEEPGHAPVLVRVVTAGKAALAAGGIADDAVAFRPGAGSVPGVLAGHVVGAQAHGEDLGRVHTVVLDHGTGRPRCGGAARGGLLKGPPLGAQPHPVRARAHAAPLQLTGVDRLAHGEVLERDDPGMVHLEGRSQPQHGIQVPGAGQFTTHPQRPQRPVLRADPGGGLRMVHGLGQRLTPQHSGQAGKHPGDGEDALETGVGPLARSGTEPHDVVPLRPQRRRETRGGPGPRGRVEGVAVEGDPEPQPCRPGGCRIIHASTLATGGNPSGGGGASSSAPRETPGYRDLADGSVFGGTGVGRLALEDAPQRPCRRDRRARGRLLAAMS